MENDHASNSKSNTFQQVKKMISRQLSRASDTIAKYTKTANSLHEIIIENSESRLEKALANGIDVFQRDKFGQTPLNLATRLGRSTMVLILLDYMNNLEMNSDLKESTFRNYRTICTGIVNDEESIIREMKDVNIRFEDNFCPLLLAVFLNKICTVKLLLQEKNAKMELIYNMGFNSSDTDKRSLLKYLMDENRIEMVKTLLDNAFDPNSDDCTYPLHYAVSIRNIDCVKLLMNPRYHIDFEEEDENGHTVLTLLLWDRDDQRNAIEIANLFLDFGLNICRIDSRGKNVLRILANHPCMNPCCSADVFCKIYVLFLLYGEDKILQPYEEDDLPYHCCDRHRYQNCAVLNHFQQMCLIYPDFQSNKVFQILQLYYLQVDFNHLVNEKMIEYKEELQKLNAQKLSSGQSLLDLLIKDSRYQVYTKDRIFRDIFVDCKDNFENQFPHYGIILNVKYAKYLRRRRLIELAKESLSFLKTNLPDECIEKIISYFTYRELVYFVDKL